jgi:hypothetical protein
MAESEENGYIFIDKIPLLYSKKNVERQQKIETWLDLYQLTSELKIAKQELESVSQPIGYIT